MSSQRVNLTTATPSQAGRISTIKLVSQSVTGPPGPAVSVSASGDTTGVTDTAAIVALLGDGARIVLGAGTFYLTAIAVANRGVQILGAGRDRGTTLRFVSSTGSLFSLGTDDGLAYDRDGYDGIQGFTLKNLSIITDAPATALSNGGGVYRTGTYAVRDWRGGSVVFDSVLIQSFEWAFWGIQSDINYFTDCIIRDNKVGFYLGPRSDQATFQHIWTFTNDIVFDLDAAKGTTVNGWQSADDGSTSTPPARIRQGSWTRTAEGITFNQPWLEHYNNAATVEAFFEVGVGDTSALGGVTINDPLVLTNATGADPYCKRLVRLGYVAGLDVSAPRGQLSNLTALVQCVGTSGVTAPASGPYVNVHNTMGQSFTLSDNTTTGSPQMTLWTHADLSHPNSGNGQMIRWQIYASNPGVRGGTGRLHVRGATATAERDFYIGADADSQFTVVHPDSATGNTTRLAIPRRIVYGTAAPTSGTYAVGDLCVNQAPARLGSAGAYYAVFGWTCTGAGAPGTWQALNIRTEAAEIVGAASDTASGIVELATTAEVVTGTDTARAVTPAGFAAGLAKQPEFMIIAVGDETTAITTGTAKVTWRMPFAFTVTAVRASLATASSSGNPAIDINEGGVSIFSTTLTIDANELTSTTAATACVISDSAIADDALMTIDIDTAGTGAKGLKVCIYGTRA